MKNRIYRLPATIVCLTLLAGILGGCGRSAQRSFDEDGKLHIVTSIFAAYDFARHVGGERADVRLLLTPGSEAHSFEPTPQDIIAIEQCDIFVCTGGENDAWVETILDAIDNPDLEIIRMIDYAHELHEEEEVQGMQEEGGLLSGIFGGGHHHHHHADHEEAEDHDHEAHEDHEEHDDHEDHEDHEEHDDHEDHEAHEDTGHEDHDHEEEETEWDEHVWMDLENAANICEAIAGVCSLKDPAGTDTYIANCGEYSAELAKIDTEIENIVRTGKRGELIFADRFPARYFIERYGLEYYAAFPGCSENTEASAATVSFLIDRAREDKVPVVLKMELSSGKLAAVVAEEAGTEVAEFYTGHNVTAEDFELGITFADMMRRNAELLGRALN